MSLFAESSNGVILSSEKQVHSLLACLTAKMATRRHLLLIVGPCNIQKGPATEALRM